MRPLTAAAVLTALAPGERYSAMATDGWPDSRLSLSWFCEPSSTRATSLMRRVEPSGLARSTISPNWSGVTRRPWVWTLNWNCWSSDAGRAPMRPTAATVFCDEIAVIRSVGARPSWVRRLVSNQTRIEYCCWLSRRAWPTPAMRLIASVTLIVR